MPVLQRHEVLQQRATARLTLAAMITSAILAPLVLGTTVIAMGRIFVTVEMLSAAALAMVPAACLGGLSMHYAAKLRSIRSLLTFAACGGVLFLGLASAICLAAIYAHEPLTAAHLLSLLMVLVMFAACGCIVSAPVGFGFGLLFLTALGPMASRLTHAAQDTPAQAAFASARMLVCATLLASCASACIGPSYTLFLQDVLHVSFAAWTRYVLFAGPLALSAAVFTLLGLLEARALQRTRSALLNDTDPQLHLAEMAPSENAIPLTDADRMGARERLVQRRDAGAYRDCAAHPIPIYVALP